MRLISIFLALLFVANGAQADNVYKWQDDQGNVHYSSKAPVKNAQPANLPPIMKGNVKLASAKITNCDRHGGVDCKRQADADGSVVCMDGFKGSVEKFKLTCTSPKLEIADIGDIKKDGTFSVYVRNSKPVAAQKPVVALIQKDNQELLLKGPQEVEPFGLAEFSIKPEGKKALIDPASVRLNPSKIKLSCANCAK